MFIAKCCAVLIASLLLGRWFDAERTRIINQGESISKAWKTTPGILIIIIVCILSVVIFFL